MSEQDNKINELLQRIEQLSLQHQKFNKTIHELRHELMLLKEQRDDFQTEIKNIKPPSLPPKYKEKIEDNILENFTNKPLEKESIAIPQNHKPTNPPIFAQKKKESSFVNWEDFLGRNLVSKIGIIILVLGIGYLTKYAIDNELINPLTRIIMGYVMASGLVVLALKWKDKYESLSAVVLTGSLGVLYFITYAAYDFYAFIPQAVAFGLMLLFTVFGMFSAHKYDRKALAYIAIVGAFAIPLLLSNNSGNYKVLFSYLILLDLGIIFFGLFKKWLGISLGTFFFSWLFYTIWFLNDYSQITDFYPSILFAALFFVVFYFGFLSYYIQVQFNSQIKIVATTIAIAINAFIFYTAGYVLLQNHPLFSEMKGLYTLLNALIHFGVFFYTKKQNPGNKTLFYVVSGLVITFITIAVPVQLDGNWVTLIWFLEAVILFGIGRMKQMKMFELFAFPILGIGFVSLLDDWDHFRRIANIEPLSPILNPQFLTNALVTAAIGTITFFAFKWKSNIQPFGKTINYLFAGLFVLLLFLLFSIEIDNYWIAETLDVDSGKFFYQGTRWFQSIWKINYSLFFVGMLVWVNRKWLNTSKVNYVVLGLTTLAIFFFLTSGLYAISEIRQLYFKNITTLSQVYLTRYVGIGVLSFLVFMIYKSVQKHEFLAKYFELAIHVILLWVLSSELIHWLDLGSSANNYRFGLTILWGIYALVFLIYRGIKKQQVLLRIAGFILFGLTLVKLFLYDLSSLETIQKTIVFIAVGILLLIVSYLYNRNKTALFGNDDPTENETKPVEENE